LFDCRPTPQGLLSEEECRKWIPPYVKGCDLKIIKNRYFLASYPNQFSGPTRQRTFNGYAVLGLPDNCVVEDQYKKLVAILRWIWRCHKDAGGVNECPVDISDPNVPPDP
jgi:hypothetical protein